jgi:LPXTG-motif cell wall-anchored protein
MSNFNSSTPARKKARAKIALSLAVTGVAVAGLMLSSVEAASAASIAVGSADVTATTRPADGGWWVDTADGTGTFGVANDTYDGTAAGEISLPSTTSGIDVHDDYSAAERPTDLPALLAGSSYSYVGTNVNFQIEVAYQPVDPQYGPTGAGSSACSSAASWGISGLPDSTWCYALLKWEPFVTTSAWTSVDLSANTAGSSAASPKIAGWMSQKRIGSYPATGARVGQTLTDYLAQMSDYQVLSVGFGAGSGAPASSSGWIKDITIGGNTVNFTMPAPTPAPPAAAPAASDTGLDQLIQSDNLNVTATTDTFSVDGGAPGTGLDALNPATPISATLPWSAPNDSFVDVYGYSSPLYLGTFPVVNGQVVLTGLNIDALETGAHRLVFLGQTSGDLSVAAIEVVAPPTSTSPASTTASTTDVTPAALSTLAYTGDDAMPVIATGGILLVLGLAGIVIARRRIRRRA